VIDASIRPVVESLEERRLLSLTATYFDNADLTGPSVRRIDTSVFAGWGQAAPDARLNADTFSVRWTGKVQIPPPPQNGPTTQTYTFYVKSDDGARLWVNNMTTPLIDNWVVQSQHEVLASISLTAGQKYDIKLEYFDNTGGANCELDWSSTTAGVAKAVVPSTSLFADGATAAPAAPSSLTATAASTGRINLTWPAATGSPSSYKVERSSDGGTTFAEIAMTDAAATGYTDLDLAPGTPYKYRVRSYNSAGTSAYTATATATTSASALPAGWTPQDVGLVGADGSATQSAGTYTLGGAGVGTGQTADSFRYAFQSLTGDGQVVARVTGLPGANSAARAGVMFRDGLTPGAFDAFLAFKPGGGATFETRATAQSSTNAGAAAVTTLTNYTGGAAIAAPAWVKIVRAGNVFTASVSPDGTTWTQVGSATVPIGATALVGLASTSGVYGTTASATFTNVAVTPAVVPPAAPGTPTLSNATVTTIDVAWADLSNNEIGFEAQWSTDPAFPGGQTTTLNAAANATSATLTGLTAGTVYYVRVRATNSAGSSAYTGAASAITAVTGVTADAQGRTHRVHVAWTDATGEAGYQVWRRQGTTGAFALAGTVAADVTQFEDDGGDLAGGSLLENTGYEYYVVATGAGGTVNSAPSATATATTAKFVVYDATNFLNPADPNNPSALRHPDSLAPGIERMFGTIDSSKGYGWIHGFVGADHRPSQTLTEQSAEDAANANGGQGFDLYIDIEDPNFPFDPTNAGFSQTVADFAQVIDWIRCKWACMGKSYLKVGIYGGPLANMGDPDDPSAVATWQAANDSMQPLFDRVDYVLTSPYTDAGTTPATWLKNFEFWNTEARRFGKPIYPFVDVNYIENYIETQNRLPDDYWQAELNVIRAHADGLVVWGADDAHGWDNGAIGNTSANATHWWDYLQSFYDPATNPGPVANAPTNLQVNASGMHLSWADSSNEAAYLVERSTDNATWTVVGGTLADETTWSDPQFTSGQRYYYRVRAVNGFGTGLTAGSGPIVAHRDAFALNEAERFNQGHGVAIRYGTTVGDINQGDWVRYDSVDFGTSPGAAAQFRAKIGSPDPAGGHVEVWIDCVDDGSGNLSGGTKVADLTTVGGGASPDNYNRSIEHTTPVLSVPPGLHTVYFRFSDAVGNVDSFTFATAANATPAAPAGLAVVSKGGQAELHWVNYAAVGEATALVVERSTDGETNWSTVDNNVPATATSYTVSGVTTKTFYRVTAVNAHGVSQPSNDDFAVPGTLDAAAGLPVAQWSNSAYVGTLTDGAGNVLVNNLVQGSWVRYSGVNFGSTGLSNFVASLGTPGGGDKVVLYLDRLEPYYATGDRAGYRAELTTQDTTDLLAHPGGHDDSAFYNYQDFTATMTGSPVTGYHDVYVAFVDLAHYTAGNLQGIKFT
jgi:hypothetical protein